MGKIIGGGLPIGGVGGKAQYMSIFDIDRVERVKHSGTYTANPMSMAAGYTGMSLLTREVFAVLDARSERLREGLRKIVADLGLEARVVGRSSLSAIFFTAQPVENYRQLAAAAAGGMMERMVAAQKLLLAEGLLTMRGGFVTSTPMTDDDVDFTLAGTRRALLRMKQM
jgi:glutamate-1-semialdehyde 2,1-aminomutase